MHGCVLIPFGGGREGEGIGSILPLLCQQVANYPHLKNKTKKPKPTAEITLMVTKRREKKKPPTTTTKTLF